LVVIGVEQGFLALGEEGKLIGTQFVLASRVLSIVLLHGSVAPFPQTLANSGAQAHHAISPIVKTPHPCIDS
jgi:hypothetical protein